MLPQGDKPLETFEDGLAVVEILMGLYRSAEIGATLHFPAPELENYIPSWRAWGRSSCASTQSGTFLPERGLLRHAERCKSADRCHYRLERLPGPGIAHRLRDRYRRHRLDLSPPKGKSETEETIKFDITSKA